jgi:peptidoglycan/xylan/chitin deacetylase (PgdA/CDA1 family)
MRAIFTYHSIDESASPISVAPAAFRRHVEWLASGAVEVVSLDAVIETDGRKDRVAVTFDDGFTNFATEAAPLLLDRGLPVTLFVATDHVGGTNRWGRGGGQPDPRIPALPLLDWAGLALLAERGVAIGSHTRRHPRLPTLAPAAQEEELAGSAARIERELGTRPRWLAYPFGALTAETVARTRAHYAGAVTTEHRVLGDTEDRHRLPRLDAYYFRAPEALARWNSSGFRGAIWLRRQARRARAMLARVRPVP